MSCTLVWMIMMKGAVYNSPIPVLRMGPNSEILLPLWHPIRSCIPTWEASCHYMIMARGRSKGSGGREIARLSWGFVAWCQWDDFLGHTALVVRRSPLPVCHLGVAFSNLKLGRGRVGVTFPRVSEKSIAVMQVPDASALSCTSIYSLPVSS